MNRDPGLVANTLGYRLRFIGNAILEGMSYLFDVTGQSQLNRMPKPRTSEQIYTDVSKQVREALFGNELGGEK